VQTPEGAGEIILLVNGVEIRMGSTVYMQATPDDYLTVNVLEGHVTLTANGVSQMTPAGTRSRVPLGADGLASGAPEYPEPYTRPAVRSVPIRLLPHSFLTANPLSEDAIQTTLTGNVSSGTGTTTDTNTGTATVYNAPPSGIWSNTGTVTVNNCDPSTLPVGSTGGGYPRFTFSDDHGSFFFDWGAGYGQYTFYRTSDTVYVANLNASTVYTMTFTSPTTYFTTFRSDGGCTFYQDEYGSYVGP
jgi:hypothetical protein